MARLKTYGPGGNCPAEELFLAKIIQNASVRGLNGCTGYHYKDVNGDPVSIRQSDKATSCCAIGAAMLETDTNKEVLLFAGIVIGNDWDVSWSDGPETTNAAESTGWAFRCAMEDES